MKMNTEKPNVIRSAFALLLAFAVVFSSIFTVAAAAQSGNTSSYSKNNEQGFESYVEYEMSNGDMLITRSENFDITVDVIKANEITVNNCGTTQEVMIAKGTVADVLEKADIKLGDNQIVVPDVNTEIKKGINVTVYNAKKISVTADGKTKSVLIPYGNIADALNIAGYNVSKDDILSVSRSSKTENLTEVTIKRVTYSEELSSEKISYKRVTENSDEIPLGETKLKTEGKNGKKLITVKSKFIDGKKVSETVTDSKIVKDAVDEVTLVGTKGAATNGGAGTFTDMYGNSVTYSQVLTGSGTAYTAPAGALTATGVTAYNGGVAVNPNIIPYGSKLYIVSTDGSFVYGYATAVDTGGALMDGSAIVDCFYNTYDECVNFGRRDVNVYVIG